MLYDLNVPWTPTQPPAELERTINFLSSLGYNTLAINHSLSVLPAQLSNPIPLKQPFEIPTETTLLRRCTVLFADPSLNHRLSQLCTHYDILALRPTNEKAFLAACHTLTDNSIISLDLTQRFPFHFKPKPLMTAVNRGIRFEICYAQAILGDSAARRNVISNLMGIVRATKGRGLIVSSEATSVLGVRGPADVINLLNVWGIEKERAVEGFGVNARGVVVNEGMKRSGFRGVIDVIDGGGKIFSAGKKPEETQAQGNGKKQKPKGNAKGKVEGEGIQLVSNTKRKADDTKLNEDGTPQISKRQAKRMRMEALKAAKGESSQNSSVPTPEVLNPEVPVASASEPDSAVENTANG
jgi:ribonuclease P/MRP protein subunit RPP1